MKQIDIIYNLTGGDNMIEYFCLYFFNQIYYGDN